MIRKLLTDGCSGVLCKTCEFFKYSSMKGNSGMRLCEIEYVIAGIKELLPPVGEIDPATDYFTDMARQGAINDIHKRLFGKEKP